MFKLWKEGVDGSFPNAAPMMFEKGGSAPPPPNPMAEAQAQILVNQENRKAEAAAAALKEEKEARQLKRDTANFNKKLFTTVRGAQDYGNERLGQLGIADNYNLLSSYNRALDTARQSVPELATDIGAYINPDAIWEKTYSTARDANRSKQSKLVDQYFGTGFENDLIADTADDNYINDILNPQYEDALSTVERARARGQLNDAAYANATKALERQNSGAKSKAQGLGQGVLAGYRSKLGTDAENLRNRVSTLDLTDVFDINKERDNIRNRASTSLAGLQGDLTNAFGDTEFFNIDNLLGRALIAGGTTNDGTGMPGTSSPLAAAMASALSEEERRRQLASTGAF